MKTISTDLVARLNPPPALLGPAGLLVGRVTPVRSPMPSWLPAPAAPRPVAAARPRSNASAKSSRSLWIAPERESRGEKLLLSLLVLAAVFGIAYGFSCMTDLVQNWAGFHSALAHMIQ